LRVLPAIAVGGRHRIYNVASGRNTSHGAIAAALSRAFGWRCRFAPDAPTVAFPPIDTTRLTAEFGAALSDLSADLRTILPTATEVACSPSMRPEAA
jgi:hypothetical protein